MIRSLFISKNVSEVTELSKFCKEQNVEIVAQSFIEFKAIPFEAPAKTDCIFFSSPRSAKFFLSKHSLTDQLIAVAGDTTKLIVESFGLNVDFVPSKSGLTEQSTKEFSNWIGAKTVLFPISTISNKSYGKYLSHGQIQEIIVYETMILSQKIQEVNCYIFTSPSNVQGFFESNELSHDAKVIAWGESTYNSLKANGITNIDILGESSQEAVIQQLKIFYFSL